MLMEIYFLSVHPVQIKRLNLREADKNSKPYERFFDSDKIDKRLPPMERIVDIENNGKYKVYTFKSIEKNRRIHHGD